MGYHIPVLQTLELTMLQTTFLASKQSHVNTELKFTASYVIKQLKYSSIK